MRGRERQINVAIVDYGVGNLFSVKHACEYAGMHGHITSDGRQILDADVVILPGVGAFGDAMERLNKLDLVAPIREAAFSDSILIGICLGMQLLMSESFEFGRHKGLGIIAGEVVRLDNPVGADRNIKVPQVGWNQIARWPATERARKADRSIGDRWLGTPLQGLNCGEYMYFVHSFYAKPEDERVALSVTRYGDIEFCSSLVYGNIFACQFHPERSGPQGLRIYENVASLVTRASEERSVG